MFYNKKTTNKSFISLWRELQRCNVTNNIFPLQTEENIINNYKLNDMIELIRGKDKKIAETVMRILTKESIENIWFYFREILFVEDMISDNNIGIPVHFEITKRIAYMFYLYSKKKSFILVDPSIDELTAFKLLWNYHRSICTDDLVILPDREDEISLFKEVAHLTSFMPVKLLMGSAQAIIPGVNHTFIMNDDVYKYFPSKIYTDDIDNKLRFMTKIDNSNPSVFMFNNLYKAYAYSMEKKYRLYGTISNWVSTKEGQIFYYTVKAFIPYVTDKIFDTPDNELQDIYII